MAAKDEGRENFTKNYFVFLTSSTHDISLNFCGRRVYCLNLVIERLSGNINLDRCKDLKLIDLSTIINYKGREDIQHCHFRQQH